MKEQGNFVSDMLWNEQRRIIKDALAKNPIKPRSAFVPKEREEKSTFYPAREDKNSPSLPTKMQSEKRKQLARKKQELEEKIYLGKKAATMAGLKPTGGYTALLKESIGRRDNNLMGYLVGKEKIDLVNQYLELISCCDLAENITAKQEIIENVVEKFFNKTDFENFCPLVIAYKDYINLQM